MIPGRGPSRLNGDWQRIDQIDYEIESIQLNTIMFESIEPSAWNKSNGIKSSKASEQLIELGPGRGSSRKPSGQPPGRSRRWIRVQLEKRCSLAQESPDSGLCGRLGRKTVPGSLWGALVCAGPGRPRKGGPSAEWPGRSAPGPHFRGRPGWAQAAEPMEYIGVHT